MADKQSAPKYASKNPSGKIVGSVQRLTAYNLYLKHRATLTKTQAVILASTAVGISDKLVWQIIGEKEATGEIKSPSKKRKRKDIYSLLCEDEKKAIRHTVHGFFKRKEIPTLSKVLQAIKENNSIQEMARSTLFIILKKLGFVWKRYGKFMMLVDRDDIILWRRRYLAKVRKYREEGRTIYYLDEIWLNSGNTRLKDLSENEHLIVAHIGNEDGFVEGGLLSYVSESNGKYHEDITPDIFEKWLKNILPSLKENCVIVLDNAPYHSAKIQETPTTKWNKENIMTFLLEKGIQCNEDHLKVELLDKVKDYLLRHPVPYRVDEIVQRTNREVLRLPPYHSNINPIELVFDHVKNLVSSNNKTFELEDVEVLFSEGLAEISSEKWSSSVDYVINEEIGLYTLDNLIEEMREQFDV